MVHPQQQQQVFLRDIAAALDHGISLLQRHQRVLVLFQLVVALAQQHVGILGGFLRQGKPLVDHIDRLPVILDDEIKLGEGI